VAIIVPLLAAALCYGIGTAILKVLGLAVDVEQKEEYPNRSEGIEAPKDILDDQPIAPNSPVSTDAIKVGKQKRRDDIMP
jgi:hypothetical protein